MLFMGGGANVLAGTKTKEQSPLTFRLRPQWACGGGTVIEIPPMFGQHYSNMAKWSGRQYFFTLSGSPIVDEVEIVNLVKKGLSNCAQFVKNYYSQ